jgi:hypothetical protein
MSARTVYVGEVVEALVEDSADRAVVFRFRVDEVLRGHAADTITVRAFRSNAPLRVCPDSMLRVRTGDRIAFAIHARLPAHPRPISTVAYLNRSPERRDLVGVERLTLARVRRLAALPPTDTADDGRDEPRQEIAWVVLALGLLAGLAAGPRIGRRGRARPSPVTR